MKTAIETKIDSSYPSLTPLQKKIILFKIKKHIKGGNKVGKGFLSKVVSKVKEATSKAGSTLKSAAKSLASKAIEVGLDKLHSKVNENKSNLNPAWVNHPLPGEKHQLLLNDGSSYRARFSGPGTRVLEDIKILLKVHNNDLNKALAETSFASAVDIEAFAHDLRYMLSNGSKDKVREADQKFISVLSHMSDPNRLIPLAAMKAKVAAEDYKLVEVYGSELNHFSAEDKKLMEEILSKLEKRGYGASGSRGPSGPLGYPIYKGPGYPPHYFDVPQYPTPELTMNPHPRPPRTITYAVDPKLTATGLKIHHGGSESLNPGFPNFEGVVEDGHFNSTNTEGRYVSSGVPLKDTYNYKPIEVSTYSVPIIQGGYDQANPLLTGRGGPLLTKKGKPRKIRETNPGATKWIDFVKMVAKRDNISYHQALGVAGPEYKSRAK